MIGNGGVSVGPHSEVKGRNEAPGRIIWNIESADVKGDFERLKAAGATVVVEPYTPEGAPEDQEIGRASCRERGWDEWVAEASRRRHTRCLSDWSSDVCSSDL